MLLQRELEYLDEEWFSKEFATAREGISSIGLKAHMEIRYGLHDSINKSQIELLNSVRKSEIHTFGWPIGITLENREEYRPRPYGDGIRTEISSKENLLLGRNSYDYWALRSNGDFFLLQSLFEDSRRTLSFSIHVSCVSLKLFFLPRIFILTWA